MHPLKKMSRSQSYSVGKREITIHLQHMESEKSTVERDLERQIRELPLSSEIDGQQKYGSPPQGQSILRVLGPATLTQEIQLRFESENLEEPSALGAPSNEFASDKQNIGVELLVDETDQTPTSRISSSEELKVETNELELPKGIPLRFKKQGTSPTPKLTLPSRQVPGSRDAPQRSNSSQIVRSSLKLDLSNKNQEVGGSVREVNQEVAPSPEQGVEAEKTVELEEASEMGEPTTVSFSSLKNAPLYSKFLQKQKVYIIPWLYSWVALLCAFHILELKTVLDGSMVVLMLIKVLILFGLLSLMMLCLCVFRKSKENLLTGLIILQALLLLSFLSASVQDQLLSEKVSRILLGDESGEDQLDLETTTAIAHLTSSFLLVPLALNSYLIVQIIQSRSQQRCLLGGSMLFIFVSMVLQIPSEILSQSRVIVFLGLGFLAFLLVLALFVKIATNLHLSYTAFIGSLHSSTIQFKKIVDNVQEAMIIVDKTAKISYQNKAALSLLGKAASSVSPMKTPTRTRSSQRSVISKSSKGRAEVPSKDIRQRLVPSLEKKMFYLYSQDVAEEEGLSPLNKSTTIPSREEGRAYSLQDLLQGRLKVESQQIFTPHKELSGARPMSQVAEFLKGLKPKSSAPGFHFCLVKVLKIAEEGKEAEQRVVQIIDISERIINDNMNIEKKYLSYINATVSHEMRNPLNSINAQIQNQKILLSDLEALTSRLEIKLAPREAGDIDRISEGLWQSLSICQSSCKLMNFNAEDIMALPQLKEGKLHKNIKRLNVCEVVDEICQVQEWSAKQKNVQISSAFLGFPSSPQACFQSQQAICLSEESVAMSHSLPSHFVDLDPQRLQQVLLNYQSNALKFMNKERGRILILVQYVPSKQQVGESPDAALSFQNKVGEFYGEDILQGQLEHSIFEPGVTEKLVLSVLDNGVGIKEQDQSKLFKLFGCLQQNRSMNTKGIGLGLVVSKMITEVFQGQVQMYSKYKAGCIFQSSFHFIPAESLIERADVRLISISQINEFKKNRSSLKSLAPEEQENFVRSFIQSYQRSQILTCLKNYQAKKAGTFREAGVLSRKILIVDDEPFNCAGMFSLVQCLKLAHVKERVEICLSGRDAIKRLLQNTRTLSKRCCRSSLIMNNPIGQMLGQGPIGADSSDSHSLSGSDLEDLEAEQLDELIEKLQSKISGADVKIESPLLAEFVNPVCDISLILTDCSMPFIDGYQFSEMARELFKALGVTQPPKIIAITGHVEPEYKFKAFASGMDQIYNKPLSFDTLSYILLENGFNIDISKWMAHDLKAKAKDMNGQ